MPTPADLERLAEIEARERAATLGLSGNLFYYAHEDNRWLTAQLRTAWAALAETERKERLAQESRQWYSCAEGEAD